MQGIKPGVKLRSHQACDAFLNAHLCGILNAHLALCVYTS